MQEFGREKTYRARRLNFTSGLVGCAALLVMPGFAFATPINISLGGGVLNISNTPGTLVGVTTIPTACISWAGAATCSGNTSHADSVSGSDPNYFLPGSAGTIEDISPPVSTVVNFETAGGGTLGLGTVHFDLLSIVTPAGFPTCNGTAQAVCSTGVFILQQSSVNQVSISFSTTEEGYTGTSGTNYSAATPYNGVFTTQLSGILGNGSQVTVANILAYEGVGGTITSTWSGTASPGPVPEPATYFLFGSGLLGLAMVGRRVTRRS
jgi:hypothetical protein